LPEKYFPVYAFARRVSCAQLSHPSEGARLAEEISHAGRAKAFLRQANDELKQAAITINQRR